MVAPLLIAAGIQAGASLLGGLFGKSAADRAEKQNAAATAQAQQVLGQNRDFVTDLYAPQVNMGNNVLGQLTDTYGVTPAAPDWNTYIAQNPDVLSVYEVMNGTRQGTQDELNFIADFQRSGKSNIGEYHASVVPGRAIPTTGGSVGGYQDPTAPSGYSVEQYFAPSYTAPSRPVIAPLDVGLDKYEASPDYLYQVSEGTRALNSGYAAKGLLQSGAAMKALTKFGQDSALEDYDQWRNYKTSTWQWDAQRSDNNYQFDANFGRSNYEDDRNFGRSTYESDRNYLAGRYDQGQNRLFALADMGQRGLDRTAEVANGFAANSAGLITNAGQVKAQAGLAGANSLINGFTGAAGALARGMSGGAGGATAASSSSYGGSYGAQSLYNYQPVASNILSRF